jgi:hypothetical protein
MVRGRFFNDLDESLLKSFVADQPCPELVKQGVGYQ